MTHVYKYTYILLICFLNTGRTISEGPDGVSHFASLQLLKMFIFFVPLCHFCFGFLSSSGGMASAWEGLLRITALSFLT